MKKFTVVLSQIREVIWDVEAENAFDAEHKTVHCDAEPSFVKIIESEINTEEDD